MKARAIAFFAICVATSHGKDAIKEYTFENDGSGNYSFEVATGNHLGTTFKHKQEGHLKNGSSSVEGSFFYKVDDRLRINVNYTADDRGYRPQIVWLYVPKTPPRGQAPPPRRPPGPGGPAGKTDISSTVLGTLVGGNG